MLQNELKAAESTTVTNGLHWMCKVGQEKWKLVLRRMGGVKWWIGGSSAEYESSWVVGWLANSLLMSIMKEGASWGNLWIIKSQQLQNKNSKNSVRTLREVGGISGANERTLLNSHKLKAMDETNTQAPGWNLLTVLWLGCNTCFRSK